MKNFTLLILMLCSIHVGLKAQANLIDAAGGNHSFEGFDAGSNNIYWWFSQVNSGAAAFTSASGIAGTPDGSMCFQATVTTAAANAYDIQTISVKQFYNLTAGTSYTFRFWAKSNAGQSINALLQDASYSTPIMGSYQYGLGLSTAWTQYTYTFTPSATASVRPVFQFGGATGVYHIDKVELGLTSQLPVELMAFKAENTKNKTIALTWKVAQEAQLKDYTIQRSSDGKNFYNLSSVAAKNDPLSINYDFQDENPLNGVNYYRLKINEQNGSFKYSAIQSATIGGKNTISVSPNPTTGAIQLKNAEGFESLDVYDLNGRLVRQFKNNATELTISDLPKGMYQVAIKANGGVSYAKIVKM